MATRSTTTSRFRPSSTCPRHDALAKLTADYKHVVNGGVFLDNAEPFEILLGRFLELERRINASSLPA